MEAAGPGTFPSRACSHVMARSPIPPPAAWAPVRYLLLVRATYACTSKVAHALLGPAHGCVRVRAGWSSRPTGTASPAARATSWSAASGQGRAKSPSREHACMHVKHSPRPMRVRAQIAAPHAAFNARQYTYMYTLAHHQRRLAGCTTLSQARPAAAAHALACFILLLLPLCCTTAAPPATASS